MELFVLAPDFLATSNAGGAGGTYITSALRCWVAQGQNAHCLKSGGQQGEEPAGALPAGLLVLLRGAVLGVQASGPSRIRISGAPVQLAIRATWGWPCPRFLCQW
ncbi:hypothetical protein NDU88_003730 [Pleurodeles waltl]|uniref:Uncharacterized protein n=1 Tax=Pleurodeles waltl TaxID=8319 RepID=A0AAV7W8C0_PLEWA|nr:hypothetical protein NDU88_003730 [Pleurodeles waltl]